MPEATTGTRPENGGWDQFEAPFFTTRRVAVLLAAWLAVYLVTLHFANRAARETRETLDRALQREAQALAAGLPLDRWLETPDRANEVLSRLVGQNPHLASIRLYRLKDSPPTEATTEEIRRLRLMLQAMGVRNLRESELMTLLNAENVAETPLPAEFDRFLSAHVTIGGDPAGFLVLTVPAADTENVVAKARRSETLWGWLVWALLTGLLLVEFGRRQQKELHRLSRRAARRRVKDLESLSGQVIELQRELEDRQRIMNEELALAREIQEGFLPRKFPFEDRLRYASLYDACSLVGGDLYDVFQLNKRTVAFFIADVSGHGVSAALITAIFKFLVDRREGFFDRNGSGQTANGPIDPKTVRDFMMHVNRMMARRLDRGRFITFLFGALDVETGQIVFGNAGHNPPLVWRSAASHVEETEVPANIPIGLLEEFDFELAETRLQPGDKLVLYTDGITERMNRTQREFGIHNLMQTVRVNGHSDPEKIAAALRIETAAFGGSEPAHDDQALLIVERIDKTPPAEP